MTVRSAPPLPRSGRLMTGGANSLELLWAILALAAIAAVAVITGIGWTAVWVEARLAGTAWDVPVTRMPGLLLDFAAGSTPEPVAQAVRRPWRPATVAAVMGLLAIAAVVQAVRRWLDWQDGWRHRQRVRDRTTSRTWARHPDLAPLLARPPRSGVNEPPAAGRLWVGTHDGPDVLVPASTSVMVVAPTRTGKSTRLVVPNLLRWDGPAVVTSVKRDVYDLTVTRRQTFGPVALFDPTGATGIKNTVRWSPLLSSVTFPDATRTATWLADAAAVEDRSEAAKFWETLATKLLAPLLFAAANTRKTITDVSHWVDRADFDEVARILAELGDEDARAAWQAIVGLPNETRGSVFGTAMAIFRAFGSPRVREATSCTLGNTGEDTLNIARLLKENGTLYLVSPEYEQAELRPLFVALVQAVYRAAVDISANLLDGAPLNPPLLLMLDEAGNIAPLQTLPKIAATGAGQGITLMTIWQDRAQIRDLYRESERTLISNHTTTLWLPGSQDLDTLKLLSDLIGDQWVAASTVSAAPDGGLSVSEGSERIDVAPPAFLRTLGHGTAVMLTGNTPPALIRTHAYYQQHRWRRLIDGEELRRHADMHGGSGPTTAERWEQKHWPAALHSGSDGSPQASQSRGRESPNPHRGSLGRVLAADYPPIPCNRDQRRKWGPGGAAIPDQLRNEPGHWSTVELSPDLAEQLGMARVDLSEPSVRRRALPHLLETGPADLVAAVVTLPQLRAEWPHLELSDILRGAWEHSYPTLADDIARQHPSLGVGGDH
jgi:type IV secretory pathway TraG/TraD family ATPase VirD4